MSERSLNSIRKRLKPEEWDIIKGIREACDEHNITIRDVRSGWLKSKSTSLNFKNPHFQDPDKGFDVRDLDFSTASKDVKPVKVERVKTNTDKDCLFDRLVFTDVHIGMEPNPDGFSMYGGKWDKEAIEARLGLMIDWTLRKQKGNNLYIDDLGDFMDGWDGQTARKGHDLPQNMSNQEAFDFGVMFKKKLIESLVPYFDKVVLNNICNDNHSADFGYIVNSAVKTYFEAKYPKNVVVNNQRKFIDYYKVGDYIFILTHGKDDKNLKIGFKPVLDNRHKTKIENWIIEHGIDFKKTIEFSKGDSHQYVFDNASSDRFNYYNYPAFSPSSDWVQTNFQLGRSGFIHFNYYKDSKTINEYFFK